MLRTLVKKELREVLPLVSAAALVEIYLLCLATGKQLGVLTGVNFLFANAQESIPFVYDGYCNAMLIVGGLLAIAIGLWQTLWEFNRGTFQYLLHRPMARPILGAKLLIGIAVSLLIGAVSFLFYALWAAAPNAYAGPFAWSMTTRFWLLVTLLPLAYLGAFLSGLRHARWLGSRSFPLFTCVLFGVGVNFISASMPGSEPALLVAVLLVEAAFVCSILHVARSTDFS